MPSPGTLLPTGVADGRHLARGSVGETEMLERPIVGCIARHPQPSGNGRREPRNGHGRSRPYRYGTYGSELWLNLHRTPCSL